MRVAPYAIVLAAAALFASPAQLAAQDDTYVPPADELALAKVIIETMFPADRREQMILDISANMAKQASEGFMQGPIFEEPGIRAVLDRSIADLPNTLRPVFSAHMPKIFEATAIAYTRQFTLEELQDISAFAQTPSGQRYFRSLQLLLSDPAVAKANQGMFEAGAPVIKAKQERLKAELVNYLEANPEVLERLQKAGVGK